jgi:hypothetical protein
MSLRDIGTNENRDFSRERSRNKVEVKSGGNFCAAPFMATLLLAYTVAAQQGHVPERTQKVPAPAFQSKVNFVLVPVVTRDSQGRAVGDLTG